MNVDPSEVNEAPNWMKELEAKREKRLRTKLGHEAGAGAPCLNCLDQCPGLDLHFWRKICKVCKCSKESHDVPDEDIYSWAQFELLGCKPNNKRKIVLPGKQDAVELEWLPKGNTETINDYLKTVPTNLLPIKGSQAAQDRKQLLQKQLPIHDIDPLLCHDLTNDEMNKMNEYLAHVKKCSVGVGQLISIGQLIKGEFHPNEAASNYFNKLPSDSVKLSETHEIDPINLQLQQINLNKTPKTKENLNNFQPKDAFNVDDVQHAIQSDYIRDLRYGNYAVDENKSSPSAQVGKNLSKGVKEFMYSTFDNNTPLNNNFSTRMPEMQPLHGNAPLETVLQPNKVPIGAIRDMIFDDNLPEHLQLESQMGKITSIDELKRDSTTGSLPNCHHCKKPFEANEFAIVLDRTSALYHAQCFKCHGCNQILADNMYFYDKETDHIYCGRDYAKVRGIPRCNACDELIFTKEYCLAQDCTFHLKHFSCFNCDKELAGDSYLIEDSNPLCLPCFELNKADKCMTCLELIKPNQQGLSVKDVHFHVSDECFACHACKVPLFEKKLLLKDSKLYCSKECYSTV